MIRFSCNSHEHITTQVFSAKEILGAINFFRCFNVPIEKRFLDYTEFELKAFSTLELHNLAHEVGNQIIFAYDKGNKRFAEHPFPELIEQLRIAQQVNGVKL